MPSPSSVSTLDRIVPIGKAGLGHDADIDAAFVVAVHKHHVPASRVEQIGVEPLQRRSILGFDDHDDVGIDAFGDHPRGHPGAGLVDGFLGQFDPADPTRSPVGDDLDVLVVSSGCRSKRPRFLRSHAQRGDVVSLRRTAPLALTTEMSSSTSKRLMFALS
jgi:hypothetical protein